MNYGLSVFSHYTYNPYGILTRINTGNKILESVPGEDPIAEDGTILRGAASFNSADSTILNYHYAYNTKGLMISRSERIMNQLETFTYDNLDRLTGFTSGKMGQQGILQTFFYLNNGNICDNSTLGHYIYGNTKPHAVKQIVNTNNTISPNECAVTYNFFNQPTEIAEGDYKLELFYGANQQRNKTLLYKNDTLKMERRYVNKYFDYEYDKTIDTAHVSRFYDYIYGDNGVVALHIYTRIGRDTIPWGMDTALVIGVDTALVVLEKGAIKTDSIYYIHTDHLGSYVAITNSTKQVRQRNWFDPWGNYPVKYDTINWKKPLPVIIENYRFNFPLTLRGFTGHEHYPQFKIINMNGRLYDPVIARFFSPDKYVVNSSFTQDFNRYSYARNNPLMYTDPSGESIFAGESGMERFLNFLTLPARLLSEGFQWIDDKMNGVTRPNGYFNMSYLTGFSEPGASFSTNSVNIVSCGHPLYVPPTAGFSGMRLGSGWSLSADNEWFNVTNRPILLKLSKRFQALACKALGIDPGKPISQEYRTAAFVYAAKNLWFKYAPNPSGGIRITTLKGRIGEVQPFSKNNVFTGESIMFLDKEGAFASMEALFLTLGHELVHVNQFLNLKGQSYTEDEEINLYKALDYYAYLFQHFLGGNYHNIEVDWSRISSEDRARIDFAKFAWAYLYNKPF
jgi:RHS repeat-associated protein